MFKVVISETPNTMRRIIRGPIKFTLYKSFIVFAIDDGIDFVFILGLNTNIFTLFIHNVDV